ncbi:MAG: hypothetical protein KQH63_07525 [Desulfobulbaceae bacterium]|nr:hypothetical protein [Desulfobulbaceae bacterium]
MSTEKKSNNTKIVIILVLLALAALALFFFLNLNQRTEKNAAISLEQEKQKWQSKVDDLEKKLSNSDQGNSSERAQATDQSNSNDTTYKQAGTEPVHIDPCQVTSNRVDDFLTHLDEQEYMEAFKEEGGAKIFVSQIIGTLLATQPKITREKDNLLSILQNTAHFYRVLGGKNIFILKKIMAHEKELLEGVMADFYEMAQQREQCLQLNYPIQLPVDKLYGYSVFFLNTLGGQAYLARRDLTLRTLTKYYCILIIDLANEKNLNHLGIDIRYPLNNLIEEMNYLSGLQDKEKYLDTLLQLQEKYEKKYGS